MTELARAWAGPAVVAVLIAGAWCAAVAWHVGRAIDAAASWGDQR